MIYPEITGKSGEHLRLKTLEAVWIQGKLRMWGRWSYIGGGKTGNMFNQLLTSKKLTKTAINEALRRMKKAGLDKPELEAFLRDMINGNQKSWLAHCTDSEALIIDRVIGEVLAGYPGLLNVLSLKWSTKTGHRVRVFSSIDFPIRLVVTHHYIRAVLVRCNIQRYSPLLRELHR
ncbi:phage antiterminator [Escherichia coli]|mgnify:CR=1 FL=1|nr:phage antiterminator [Escherichia coli]